MGVPAFFRWLTAKYPKTLEYATEELPARVDGVDVPLDLLQESPNGEVDNFYIDMNGIIHPCSHPEDGPAPPTEEHMLLAVMRYVDRLFAVVRPRKVFFLAVDGVAPRAKMNQQRSRRFRSAEEADQKMEVQQNAREELARLGLKVPPEEKDKALWSRRSAMAQVGSLTLFC